MVFLKIGTVVDLTEKNGSIYCTSLAQMVLELWPFKVCNKCWYLKTMSTDNMEYLSSNDTREVIEELFYSYWADLQHSFYSQFTSEIKSKGLTSFITWCFQGHLMHQLNSLLLEPWIGIWKAPSNNSNIFCGIKRSLPVTTI